MARKAIPDGLSFSSACEYLGLSAEAFTALREQGLIVAVNQDNKQFYLPKSLDITRQLLVLGKERGWQSTTLTWYADLIFATEVGRAILLPIASNQPSPVSSSVSWLGTAYATAVCEDLYGEVETLESPLVTLIRSIVATTVGENQFWPDKASLEQSELFPIIAHLESKGITIFDQGTAIARDVAPIFGMMLLAFINIAPPLTQDLKHLVQFAYDKLKTAATSSTSVSLGDQTIIEQETDVAVDRMYASKATEIHTPPEAWDFNLGVLKAERRTIAIQMKLPFEATQDIIDNIIDVIRPYVGLYGARVVHLLYEVANDPPYWRNPLITIDTNEFLDRLGIKRDKHGYHYSDSRERLRNALNAAHNLEIVGEYTAWENGRQVRRALRRTVLSLIGATFDAEESQALSTSELFQRGLPKTMQIRLNFYDGVRRPDGKLGNHYVTLPRLGKPETLASARHASTEELLKAYLLARYRQSDMESLTITRAVAMEKANITNKNVTRATQTLVRALNKLTEEGIVQEYSPIPLKPQQSFTVTLNKRRFGESES